MVWAPRVPKHVAVQQDLGMIGASNKQVSTSGWREEHAVAKAACAARPVALRPITAIAVRVPAPDHAAARCVCGQGSS